MICTDEFLELTLGVLLWVWELDIDAGGSVGREDWSWYHWDGARNMLEQKMKFWRKKSELGDGLFTNRGKINDLGK